MYLGIHGLISNQEMLSPGVQRDPSNNVTNEAEKYRVRSFSQFTHLMYRPET